MFYVLSYQEPTSAMVVSSAAFIAVGAVVSVSAFAIMNGGLKYYANNKKIKEDQLDNYHQAITTLHKDYNDNIQAIDLLKTQIQQQEQENQGIKKEDGSTHSSKDSIDLKEKIAKIEEENKELVEKQFIEQCNFLSSNNFYNMPDNSDLETKNKNIRVIKRQIFDINEDLQEKMIQYHMNIFQSCIDCIDSKMKLNSIFVGYPFQQTEEVFIEDQKNKIDFSSNIIDVLERYYINIYAAFNHKTTQQSLNNIFSFLVNQVKLIESANQIKQKQLEETEKILINSISATFLELMDSFGFKASTDEEINERNVLLDEELAAIITIDMLKAIVNSPYTSPLLVSSFDQVTNKYLAIRTLINKKKNHKHYFLSFKRYFDNLKNYVTAKFDSTNYYYYNSDTIAKLLNQDTINSYKEKKYFLKHVLRYIEDNKDFNNVWDIITNIYKHIYNWNILTKDEKSIIYTHHFQKYIEIINGVKISVTPLISAYILSERMKFGEKNNFNRKKVAWSHSSVNKEDYKIYYFYNNIKKIFSDKIIYRLLITMKEAYKILSYRTLNTLNKDLDMKELLQISIDQNKNTDITNNITTEIKDSNNLHKTNDVPTADNSSKNQAENYLQHLSENVYETIEKKLKLELINNQELLINGKKLSEYIESFNKDNDSNTDSIVASINTIDQVISNEKITLNSISSISSTIFDSMYNLITVVANVVTAVVLLFYI